MLSGIDRIAERGRDVMGKVARVAGALTVGLGLSGIGASPVRAESGPFIPGFFDPKTGITSYEGVIQPGDRVILGPEDWVATAESCGIRVGRPGIPGVEIINGAADYAAIAAAGNRGVNLRFTGAETTMGNTPGHIETSRTDALDYPAAASATEEARIQAVKEIFAEAARRGTQLLMVEAGQFVVFPQFGETGCDIVDRGFFGPDGVTRFFPPTQPAVSVQPTPVADTIARCGKIVSLTDAAAELRGVGFPGPFDQGSVQAAMDRTVNCGGGAVPVRATESAGNCFPPARTVFAPEGDANIDGTDYHADLRDLPSCVRFVGTWELGIDDPTTPKIIEGAHNFKVRIPRGWSMVVSPTSVAVHREGGTQRDFVDGQVVVVDGPFIGGVGMFEGSAGLTLTDWASPLADQRLVTQRRQAIGKSNVNVVKFQG